MAQGTIDFDSYHLGSKVFTQPAFSQQEPCQSIPETAESLRDEALERVVRNAGDDWKSKALRVIREMPASSSFIGEDVRLACEAKGIFPHHQNAWGGLISSAVKAGLISATGEYRTPTSKKTHARKSQVYRRV